MRILLYRSIIFTCISFFSLVATAQLDISEGVLDLRNEIRTFWQKSAENVAPNMVALPVLDRTKSKTIHLKPVKNTAGRNVLSIVQDNRAESYFLFSDMISGENDPFVVHSLDGLWISELISNEMISEQGRLMIGPYHGDISIEFLDKSIQQLNLHQVYTEPINYGAMDLLFDASFKCHRNINCEAGKNFSDEKRSVMRIRMVADEGVALCSGTLLNNTSDDGTPFVLTAYHCLVPPDGPITPFFDMWRFDFHYEGLSCANPESEPIPLVIQGAEKLAEWEETDMMLVRMTGEIPADANLYYAGWNRDPDFLADTTYLIHHPVGDIKKISIDIDKAEIHKNTVSWNNGSTSPNSSHLINEFDQSAYEPGSSGASVMDQNGLVVGQLHGGPLTDESCTLGIGYSGRLSLSWNTGDADSTRLSDWLDPEGLGQMVLEGRNEIQNQAVRFTGKVVTADGLAIPDVRIELTGDEIATLLTGSDGRFVFENLAADGNYEITIFKNTNAGNGLSSTDLVIIRNHIIGRRILENEFVLRAADVNRDGNISSVDLVQIKNVIIGRQSGFPGSPSWDFKPNVLQMTGGNTGAGATEVNIIGFKLGDVNFSAKPGN